jgi:nitric oxide reductase NorE protein
VTEFRVADEDLPEFLRAEPAPGGSRAREGGQARRPPGEYGLWIFILGDMTLFAVFFVVFAWEARRDRGVFEASARELLMPLGAVNTLVLLLSSLLVVACVRSFARGAAVTAARCAAGAVVCALAFAAIKVVEYGHVLSSGYTPATNQFFTLYFVLTGIHLLHVLVGTVLLLAVRRRARGREAWSRIDRFVEGSGVYWHMVDLLWVVLFSLLYLVEVA